MSSTHSVRQIERLVIRLVSISILFSFRDKPLLSRSRTNWPDQAVLVRIAEILAPEDSEGTIKCLLKNSSRETFPSHVHVGFSNKLSPFRRRGPLECSRSFHLNREMSHGSSGPERLRWTEFEVIPTIACQPSHPLYQAKVN
jgi:hypothetical protein